MLRRLARGSVRHRRLVILAWLAGVAGLLGLGITFAGESNTDFSLPGTESQQAADLLEAANGGEDPFATGQVVIATDPAIDGGVHNPEVQTLVEDLLAEIAAEVPSGEIDSPYEADAYGMTSPDGTVAFAEVNLGEGNDSELTERIDAIKELGDQFEAPGVTVELAGDYFIDEAPGGATEGVGMLLALGILFVAFGSLIAAGLPLLTALFGVGAGAALVMLAANVVNLPSFAISLTIMLGIGVGIDYALLIATRYRTGLAEGRSVEDAVVRAMDTAGRSVLFAGCTVAIAITGMLMMGGSVGVSMVIAAAAGVLMVMAAALTLLPALLGVIGHRIDKFGLPHRTTSDERPGLAYRWSRLVQRHPWPAAIAAVLVLAALAAPALGLRLGFSDAGNRPDTDTTRRAYDLLAEGYGEGANGPLLLVAETADASDQAVLEGVAGAVAGTDGVVDVTPPMAIGDSGVSIVRVVPETGPQDEATSELVHTLRDEVIPEAVSGTDLEVFVTGATAAGIDFADSTLERLPLLLGGVLLASFALLGVVFRSLVIPLKAIIMNLLSLGAAFGVIVAVFQWGWGMELIGVGKAGPTEAWVPMTLFAIAYGLSMDYEVFLLSRIREEYVRTRDNATAVADGLAKTAKVITAAALIMVSVFGSFVLFDDRGMKTMGLGLAMAILVDATIVRMLLVPAVMELLGERNWWWPKALHRLPSFDVDKDADVRLAPEPALAAER
ncbi:MAG TPA: MMPL family transporter [Jiangellaceae bacterium]|nr:MMPL family transporter [Jiangellaceae bacterium]